MTPQYLTMIGLGFDIVGGFLVAVEAIKIENLRALRDRVLKRTNSYILGPRILKQDVLTFDSNPIARDDECCIENSQKKEPEDSLPAMGCLPLLILHVVVGFTVLLLLNKLLDGMIYTKCLSAVSELSWLLQAGVLLLVIIIGIPLSGAIGSGIFSAFSVVLRSTMKAVDFIESETPTGTIGIIGFLLLALGFLFQFVATYLTLQ
jgi:hypothetical protein